MPPSKKTAKRRTAQAAPISTTEIRKRLTAFSHNWKGGKDEKADAQTFTLRLLECYGLCEHHYLREGRVPKLGGATGFMDGFIPGKLIIEFKSLGKDLKKAAEQAMGYRWGFPWPDLPASPEPKSREHKLRTAVENAAQAVLDTRAKFQTGDNPSTLADLYDPRTMPPELTQAHQQLDKAVDAAYGYKHFITHKFFFLLINDL